MIVVDVAVGVQDTWWILHGIFCPLFLCEPSNILLSPTWKDVESSLGRNRFDGFLQKQQSAIL